MAQKRKVCAYCGKDGTLTKDHVPPKLLFLPSARQNLITVPACVECNGGFSKEDEYLRLVLSIRQEVEDGPSGAFLWDNVLRSLKHPEAARMKAKVVKSVHRVKIRDHDGTERKGLALETDYVRLKLTAQRIIKGLFYHQTGKPLAQGYVAIGRFAEYPEDAAFLQKPSIFSQLTLLESSPIQERGDGTLRFKLVSDPSDENNTYWAVEILNSMLFFGITFKPQRLLNCPHGKPL